MPSTNTPEWKLIKMTTAMKIMRNFVIFFPLVAVVCYANICLLYSQRPEFHFNQTHLYSYKRNSFIQTVSSEIWIQSRFSIIIPGEFHRYLFLRNIKVIYSIDYIMLSALTKIEFWNTSRKLAVNLYLIFKWLIWR